LCNEVRGNQARVKNTDLRHSSLTGVMQKRKKTQICVTRPQCVKLILTQLSGELTVEEKMLVSTL
jgi:hypothetical protein